MAIKFLNKTNTNDISVVQNRLAVGADYTPQELLHVVATGFRTFPTIRLEDNVNNEGGGTGGPYFLNITQNSNTTSFTSSGTMEFFIPTGGTTPGLIIAPPGFPGLGRTQDVGINTSFPNAALDVNGGIRMANDIDVASADKAGTMRYREQTNNRGAVIASHLEMCMLIDVTNSVKTYDWVSIKQNTW